MRVLHTEASPGWGGQELRVLQEARGMRRRGHEVIFLAQKKGALAQAARDSGFLVYEAAFKKTNAFSIAWMLRQIIHKHHIEIVNTHSSLDAWIGGAMAKWCGCKIVRTRHLSTPIQGGINSYLLYGKLADCVVTTCEETSEMIRRQAQLPVQRCLSIPTGVDVSRVASDSACVRAFREQLGVKQDECLAGTLCILRGWKGISDLLFAAKLLKEVLNLKWLIVGSGVSEGYFKEQWRSLGLEKQVLFTGHLASPYTALAAMDIFLLLSWANEGVSQASLQAAWLEKPLITTSVGGLREVCLDQKTGIQVEKQNPQAVAQAVLRLMQDQSLRQKMGRAAKEMVKAKFTLNHTLDQMEKIYTQINS